MPASLLDSQLAALEPPAADEAAMTVEASDPDRAVDIIVAALARDAHEQRSS